jgi:hypothetical protein
MAIIVGLEGVLARHEWRHGLIESEGWDAYHAALGQDAPNHAMVQLVRALHLQGQWVHCITSRPEKWRQATTKWMALHGVLVDQLHMRGEKDFRSDVELRGEVVDLITTKGIILLAVEENEKACDVYRAAGITTLQLTNPSVQA